MTPGGQKPSRWLCLAKFPREMYSQPIVHKALSWGAIRKSHAYSRNHDTEKSPIRKAPVKRQYVHFTPLLTFFLVAFR